MKNSYEKLRFYPLCHQNKVILYDRTILVASWLPLFIAKVIAIVISIQRLFEEWGVETFGEQAYFHLIEPLELNGKLQKFYAKDAPKIK